MGNLSSRHFAAMLDALAYPGAFPEGLPGDAPIALIQTHASAVFLTPERAYKLKKPKDFGFFDYSTPALRRHFCQQEVRLNSSLAPQIYLGVAPVIADGADHVRIGIAYAPDEVPLPEAPLEDGHVVDYAVVMVRLPDAATLESMVRLGDVSPQLLAEVAHTIAMFHATTATNTSIASFGDLAVIQGNWEENFAQMKPYIGRTLDATIYDHIVTYVQHFIEGHHALFMKRVQDGRIRDCHGDLRLPHIYLLETKDAATHAKPRLAILDRIEFNERFRYGDVASEIAFLTMELDAACRADLAQAFVNAYQHEAGDESFRELLPFYCCYRACVRGKVFSFQIDEREVPEDQRKAASQTATALFALAAHYASGPTTPILVMIGGLMGTGKSTLAHALQQAVGWPLFSSDDVRKQLAHVHPAQPQADAFGQGMYRPEWTQRTYEVLQRHAYETLSRGQSVLLDASFLRRADRQRIANMAASFHAVVLFVECSCPREVALRRLALRWQKRTEGMLHAEEKASQASDGRPALFDTQRELWEAFVPAEEPGVKQITITTTAAYAVSVEHVLDEIHLPHFSCCI